MNPTPAMIAATIAALRERLGLRYEPEPNEGGALCR